jgi:hypothetical protein
MNRPLYGARLGPQVKDRGPDRTVLRLDMRLRSRYSEQRSFAVFTKVNINCC